jgi:hypothetical protein
MTEMDLHTLITQMSGDAERIAALVAGVSNEQARWKPTPVDWSILEVVNHLYDEEREDFRARLNLILHDPEHPWSPIDPQGWVTARRYNERDLAESLANFLGERQQSVTWLRSLETPNWETAVPAPWGGAITAGEMMAAWVAHDLLHLRQLVELQWAHVQRLVAPFATEYAGDW